jgi:ABC-type iron transport system FetAB permease component
MPVTRLLHHCHVFLLSAMTPMLNQMAVIGLVSIPGMMTGQVEEIH